MGLEIKLPDLGDGVESGGVLAILVREGDSVAKDQSIMEIETDKATVEVPAPQSGRIERVHVVVGQNVVPGESLMTMEPAAATVAPSTANATKSTPPNTAETKPTPAPAVAKSAPPKPAKVEPPRPVPIAAKPKATPSVETEESLADSPVVDTPAASSTGVRRQGKSTTGPVPAGPAIRRFAREVGVDLAHVHGTGPGGRVTRNDVLDVVRHVSRAAKENGTSVGEDAHLPGEPGQDEFGPVRIESASRIRRTIAARMHQSWTTVPRVTNFDDADITELEKVRQASKDDYAANGIKLTTMPFVVKAVSMALKRHPLVNAAYDAESGEIIYKRYVNVGMAVDSDRGLVVPVLRNTDQLSISELARLIAQTAERVRQNEFELNDLRGGTFTVSNLGAVGGTYSTPIVNTPEVAILLLGRARKLPVVRDDAIVIRLMMPLSLAYDHRLIDGATAARFLNDVIAYLQAPSRLLLAP